MKCCWGISFVILSVLLGTGALLPSTPQRECFSWSLSSANEPQDTSAWISLHDTATNMGDWKLAEIRGPRIASRGWQSARWRSLTTDSISITWRGPFSSGVFRLARTPTTLIGVLEWSSDVVVRDSTGALRAYRRTEPVRAVAKPCSA